MQPPPLLGGSFRCVVVPFGYGSRLQIEAADAHLTVEAARELVRVVNAWLTGRG